MPVDINRGTAGVVLPKQVTRDIWSKTQESSVIMRVAQKIDLPGAGKTIPIITGLPSAAWVAETDKKPIGRATLASKNITPYTMALIHPFSNQFRRDLSALYAEIVRKLPAALGQLFDSTVYGAVTKPGDDFDQINGAPAKVIDTTDTLGDLAQAYQSVATNRARLSHWIVNPALQSTLFTTQNTLGQLQFISDPANQDSVTRILGRPVIETTATMPTSTSVGDTLGYAGDFAGGAVWGSVEGIQMSISDQSTLDDNGTLIHLWQQNMFAVRFEVEMGFRVRDVNDFVSLTDGAVDTP